MSEPEDNQEVDSQETTVVPHPERPRCPFYGFFRYGDHLGEWTFIDQRGNQCALAEGYTSCRMGFHGDVPNWDKCSFYNIPGNLEVIETMRARGLIYPRELLSEGEEERAGIPLGQWFEIIMNQPAE